MINFSPNHSFVFIQNAENVNVYEDCSSKSRGADQPPDYTQTTAEYSLYPDPIIAPGTSIKSKILLPANFH